MTAVKLPRKAMRQLPSRGVDSKIAVALDLRARPEPAIVRLIDASPESLNRWSAIKLYGAILTTKASPSRAIVDTFEPHLKGCLALRTGSRNKLRCHREVPFLDVQAPCRGNDVGPFLLQQRKMLSNAC